ncbi:hypothetical protein CVT25_001329 [Psilocybe cyanescens]|uniref:Uncharacterized protein n=1 Tax=Psilocybe cyanescens TaxID=93625 RepID=A0A409XER0_PSICY|nr:hypothetical protein CVT25_001329 [Psilocybe cyanescens]
MSPSTIYLITGASRPCGIGIASFSVIHSRICSHCLAFAALTPPKNENAFIYVTARDLSKKSSLDDLKAKYPNRGAIITWIAANVESNTALAKEIEERHRKVDILLSALLSGAGKVHEADISASPWEDHFKANVLGPTVLFKSIYELLKKSSNPRFIPISSMSGSLVALIHLDMRNTAYASTKATLNYIAPKIHFENEWLGVQTTHCLDWHVKDDHIILTHPSGSLNKIVEQFGKFPTADKAAVLLLKIIDESTTREKDDGQFINLDGARIPW